MFSLPFGLPFSICIYTTFNMATRASSPEGGQTELVPLCATGVDFRNKTQAEIFLKKLTSGRLLHGPEDADFWYGIVIVIGLATLINAYFLIVTWLRYAVNSCLSYRCP